MPRVNERCIEHTPDEYRVNNLEVPSQQEIMATAQDLNGAKIHCCWIFVDSEECTAVFDYLSKDGERHLEERGPLPLEKGKYTRFQFGTYKPELPLPAMNLRVRIKNNNGHVARATVYGMSQLQ